MDTLRDAVIRGREEIYDEIVQKLTRYENPEDYEDYDDVEWESEFYKLLVKIQNRWEDTITAQND